MTSVVTVIPIVQGLLGLAMLVAGSGKLLGVELSVEDFERYGYPVWFRFVAGGVETIGGLGLLAGLLFTPVLAVLGGTLVVATMIGAFLTHQLRVDDPLWRSVVPIIYATAGLIVTSYQLQSV